MWSLALAALVAGPPPASIADLVPPAPCGDKRLPCVTHILPVPFEDDRFTTSDPTVIKAVGALIPEDNGIDEVWVLRLGKGPRTVVVALVEDQLAPFVLDETTQKLERLLFEPPHESAGLRDEMALGEVDLAGDGSRQLCIVDTEERGEGRVVNLTLLALDGRALRPLFKLELEAGLTVDIAPAKGQAAREILVRSTTTVGKVTVTDLDRYAFDRSTFALARNDADLALRKANQGKLEAAAKALAKAQSKKPSPTRPGAGLAATAK